MVDNTLVHFKTKENFKREKGNIQDTSIAFIKDSKLISTHDTIYNFVNWNVLDENIVEVPSKYEFVDLGLPSGLKWAAWNVGATKPEEFGLYFAWGETEGYSAEDVNNSVKKFTWSDYELCNGSDTTLTKYNTTSSIGVVDNLTTLEQVDDVAYQSDNTCRMPTSEDFKELIAYTTSTWETLNGVNGKRFTSKTNGNSIFVPAAAGFTNTTFLGKIGLHCFLWSSTVRKNLPRYAACYIMASNRLEEYDYVRCRGFSVRPVKSIN